MMSIAETRRKAVRDRAKPRETAGTQIAEKRACFTRLMQKTEPLTTASLGVPGVEVVDRPPDGCTKILGPYWDDQIEMLRRHASGLRDRPQHIVVPDGCGYSVFTLPAKTKGAK